MLPKISCLRRKILQCTSTPPRGGDESSPICVKQLELSRGGACEYVSLSTALQNAPRPSPTPKQKKASALNSFSPLTSLACQKVFGQWKQKQTKPFTEPNLGSKNDVCHGLTMMMIVQRWRVKFHIVLKSSTEFTCTQSNLFFSIAPIQFIPKSDPIQCL